MMNKNYFCLPLCDCCIQFTINTITYTLSAIIEQLHIKEHFAHQTTKSQNTWMKWAMHAHTRNTHDTVNNISLDQATSVLVHLFSYIDDIFYNDCFQPAYSSFPPLAPSSTPTWQFASCFTIHTIRLECYLKCTWFQRPI